MINVRTHPRQNGIEDASFVHHDNTLARPYISWGKADRVDIVLTNPPFGGREEDGIESNFPRQFRTRETADLFLALIIRLQHLDDCVDWWGGTTREGREETDRAWKVSIDDIKARGYNLDIKNPYTEEQELGDPEELLEQLTNTEAEIQVLRDEMKAILGEALSR